ncbi:MAG: 2-C-methyl-D-erythritol 2,4-cyclodiphosphate synthase [Candidatus Margulisiibacteriota bacterium]|jgi:2-C-methyl-D-erythritol 2,4-cyclodiphosphate synthase
MLKSPRIGLGYDSHQLVMKRPLILGGVEIPFEKGLLGHSDADCLIHAIIDALLGALALGSIGDFFPDTDAQYKNISSLTLLKEVQKLLEQKKAKIMNIDSVLILERPKMAPFISQIRENLAQALQINFDQIFVKAKTNEKMGFEGTEQGISARAVALIELL